MVRKYSLFKDESRKFIFVGVNPLFSIVNESDFKILLNFVVHRQDYSAVVLLIVIKNAQSKIQLFKKKIIKKLVKLCCFRMKFMVYTDFFKLKSL